VFAGCDALTAIDVAEGNPAYVSKDGVLFNKGETKLLRYPAGKEGAYEIPDGVESVEISAFAGSVALRSVKLPASLAIIKENAFSACAALIAVVFSDGDALAEIGDEAFAGCAALTAINLPDGLKKLGKLAFENCAALERVFIPGSLKDIGADVFQGCGNLKEIEVAEGAEGFETDEHGVLFGGYRDPDTEVFTFQTLIRYPSANTLTAYTVPKGVTEIANFAFADAAALKKIELPDGLLSIGGEAFAGTGVTELDIPSSISRLGSSNSDGYLENSAFADMPALRWIAYKSGLTSLPMGAMASDASSDFANAVGVYVPSSVSEIHSDAADSPPSEKLTVCGFAGSDIEEWAGDNGVSFVRIEGDITKLDYDDAWRLVPYQYIIERIVSGVYDDEDLRFEYVGGDLPNGLELLDTGQFHGAPLETGGFVFFVAVRFTGDDSNTILDLQGVNLTVEEPEDVQLADTNDYTVADFIGVPTTVDGGYRLTGSRAEDGLEDQRFEAADALPKDSPGYVNNFQYFVDFWLDGRPLDGVKIETIGQLPDPTLDYFAEEGSTVVTVYAKTFQDLNVQNGEHTIAAEFMIDGVQKVSAQKFTLELTDASTDPPSTDPPDTDPGDTDDEGGNGNEPGNTPADPSGDNPSGASGAGGDSDGAGTAAAPGDSGNAATTADNAATTADNAAAAPGGTEDAQGAAAGAQADGAATEANTAAGTEIDGLPRDADGRFYFELDGSGRPFEVRIDIPLAEFQDLYFDGELWARDAEYEAREGSTVLTIAAEKLADFAYGMHEVAAHFTEDRVVLLAFELRGSAAGDGETGLGADEARPAEESASADAGRALPVPALVLAALAVVLLGAFLVLRARRRHGPEQ
jgi:hypothetical protein